MSPGWEEDMPTFTQNASSQPGITNRKWPTCLGQVEEQLKKWVGSIPITTFPRLALQKHCANWHRVWSRPWNYVVKCCQFTGINPVETLVKAYRRINSQKFKINKSVIIETGDLLLRSAGCPQARCRKWTSYWNVESYHNSLHLPLLWTLEKE